MHRLRLGLGLTCLLVGAGVCFQSVLTTLRSVNEPDPGQFPLKLVEKNLKGRNIESRVRRVLYVNRDFDAYVFEGELKLPLTTSKLRNRSDQVLSEEGYQNLVSSSCFGEIRFCNRNGKQIVGIVLSSTQGEWCQGAPIFRQKWEELTK